MHSASIRAGDRKSSPRRLPGLGSRGRADTRRRPWSRDQASARAGVAGGVGIVQRQRQGEGGVGVHRRCGSDRSALGRKSRNRSAKASASGRRVAAQRGSSMRAQQLRLQLQQPGPAVGPLEAPRERAAPDRRSRPRPSAAVNGVVEQGADGGGLGDVRDAAQQAAPAASSRGRRSASRSCRRRSGAARAGPARPAGPSSTWSSLLGYSRVDVAERDAGEAARPARRSGGIGVSGRRGHTSAPMLAASMRSAVGICALITA